MGLTQKLAVPDLISQEKFSEIMAVASGIPGSDAIQMAWQTGLAVKGISGAIVSVLAALIPTISLVCLVSAGLKLVQPKILSKFFDGVNPALAIMLVFTAISLFPKAMSVVPVAIALIALLMLSLNVPIPICLVVAGLIGVFFL